MITSFAMRVLMVLGLVASAALPASALAQGAPAAPSGLAGTVVSTTEMKLDWTDNSLDETEFRIERSPDGATFAPLATVAADVTTYSDTSVVGDVLYFYRVFAVNANGDSNPSNIFSGYTADSVPPPSPTLTSPPNGATLGGHTIRFEWTAVPDISGVTYTIVVTDLGNGIVLHNVSGITGTSIDLLVYDANYAWTVSATDGALNAGAAALEEYCYVLNEDTAVPDCSITSPNGGETLAGGSDATITWYCLDDLTSTPELGISLFFSCDGGASWTSIGSPTTNEGAYRWSVPRVNSDLCLVRMTATDANRKTGADPSDAVFSIVTDSSSGDSLVVSSHNSGRALRAGSTQTISWQSAVEGGDVSIKLYKGSRLVRVISKRTPDDGSFTWKVPLSLKGGDKFRIRVTQLDSPAVVADDCDKPFSVR